MHFISIIHRNYVFRMQCNESVLLAIFSLLGCFISGIITTRNLFENQLSTLCSSNLLCHNLMFERAKKRLDVFQADFATSAVDFLHRVGRTARAGQYGLVTSLYTESNRDLVDAIRRAGKVGQPVVIIKTRCYMLDRLFWCL